MAGDQDLEQAEPERSAGEHSSVPDFESPSSSFKVHLLGHYSNRVELSGADRARTGDLLVANQALYQLSYSPAMTSPG
jgi:hypothetical protein